VSPGIRVGRIQNRLLEELTAHSVWMFYTKRARFSRKCFRIRPEGGG
jgi:hypothetical protein